MIRFFSKSKKDIASDDRKTFLFSLSWEHINPFTHALAYLNSVLETYEKVGTMLTNFVNIMPKSA